MHPELNESGVAWALTPWSRSAFCLEFGAVLSAATGRLRVLPGTIGMPRFCRPELASRVGVNCTVSCPRQVLLGHDALDPGDLV